MAQNETSFIDAVNSTAEIAGHCQPGLQALGNNSAHVRTADPHSIDGSVNIDECLKHDHPSEPRWDYAVGYAGDAFFIEVHPANTSNVEEMIKKVVWLKNWLKSSAPTLLSLHRCGVFHWIPSGKVKILPNSSQSRKIAQNNLKITRTIMVLQ